MIQDINPSERTRMTAIILINTVLSAAALGGLAYLMTRQRTRRVELLHVSRQAAPARESEPLRRAA